MNSSLTHHFVPALLADRNPLPEKVFVVRHGRSVWNGTKRVTGQLNPPLAEEGRSHAKHLAELLRAEPLTAIYASDLVRAVETAAPTARHHGIAIQQYIALREQHLGVAQGRFRDQRDPETQVLWCSRDADRSNFRIPGGETYRELETRVTACLREIMLEQAGGTILIVGHRNTNRVVLAALLGWSEEDTMKVKVHARHVYEIAFHRQPPVHTLSLHGEHMSERRGGFWS